jgi:isoquinoline 1-oxidoreductase beta subunit
MSGEKTPGSKLGKTTRRTFLVSSGLLGGGLALGITLAPNRLKMTSPAAVSGSEILLNTWVKITPDNQLTVIVPHSEMGQGIGTGLAQMLAEEMDADWDTVAIEQAPADDAHVNSDLGRGYILGEGAAIPSFVYPLLDFTFLQISKSAVGQITGGSTAIRFTGYHGMRRAGAAAKDMLLHSASETWGVALDSLRVAKSVVYHDASNRSATFGELSSLAATYTPPLKPALKSFDKYTIVGQPKQRLDIPEKTDGSAVFGMDVIVPNMLYAAIEQAPVVDAKIVSIDDAALVGQSNITKVINLNDAVVVVADSYWEASRALEKLEVQWAGGREQLSSAELHQTHENDLDTQSGEVMHSVGDAVLLLDSEEAIAAQYAVPYLAHATMEPMNCTAWVQGDQCDIWMGHQNPMYARNEAASVLGIDRENVTIHNCYLGGGFGRRSKLDVVSQAVRVAREIDVPVKLVWSREQDMSNDFYRPAIVSRMKGVLDGTRIQAMSHSYVYTDAGMPDSERPFDFQYEVENKEISRVNCPSPIPTGAWRSVDFTQMGFFNESFVDELANRAGMDPLEFRLAHKTDQRERAVLERLRLESNWGQPATPGSIQGVAIVNSFGSIVGQVVELSVDEGLRVNIERVTSVVDCGLLINPSLAEAQIQGSVIFGLTAAVFGEVTLRDGKIEQQNFPSYDMLRMANTPRQSVHFLLSDHPPGGLGEPGVPAAAPALANAIFAATGTRIRQLPITRSGFSVA